VRIALLADGRTANAAYRSIGPMLALAERGHEVRILDVKQIDAWHATLRWCELLHIHRVCDGGAVNLARAAKAVGAAVVWDDDDNVTRVPRGTSGYADAGGLKGSKRLAARARLFESVDLVTTPSLLLAETFREAGAPAVQVIENYVLDVFLSDRASRADFCIGWVAGAEHKLDLQSIPVASAVERLLKAHPHVTVTTVGVRLEVVDERYRHVPRLPFRDLLQHVSAFDVGIAPLSPNWSINHTRSNVKLKEYASVGVPWLASPIGPYAALGEREGGRLVADDCWYEQLDALVRDNRTRRKLAKRALRWGNRNMLSRNVTLWEQAFLYAIEYSRCEMSAA
jgi:glycosyltransferase involved in cell wall biosynthesis